MPTVAQTVYDALIFAGCTPNEAAGILGNMVQESGLNPEEQVMDSNGAMSRGLIMWNDKGAGAGINWGQYITGNVTNDIVQQVLLLKAQGAFQAAAGNSAAESASNFMRNFERPAAASANEARRVNMAVLAAQAATTGDWFQFGNTQTGPVDSSSFAGSTAGGGGSVTSLPGNSINGQPLTMADIPQVLDWIHKNWGSYAWLLNIPEVASLLEKAAVQGLSPDQVQAQIEQTNWWRTTSAAMRQFEQDKATNPADYNFSTPGSKASQMYAQIANAAAGYGVELTPTQIQFLALQALQFGWTTQQIQENVGKGATMGNAQQVVQQINAMANQYFQTLTPQVESEWVQQLAGGTRTMPEFQALMAQQAAQKWTGYSQQLLNGYTMQQLTDNLRQEAAKTMEIDPNAINFTTDPVYQKILDFAPPTPSGTNQLPQHRVMTTSEMDQYLKGLPQWGLTQNARNATATIEQTLLQNFGKITG